MATYKVTYVAVKPGFFSDTTIEGVELYEAKDAREAKKMCEAEIAEVKRKLDMDIFSSAPIITVKDIEKME